MLKNFEFDTTGHVATELAKDPGFYILDRTQEIYDTRLGKVIEKTAELTLPDDGTDTNKFHRIAFSAGAIIVLDAFDNSDAAEFKSNHTKHEFLRKALPKGLIERVPDAIRKQIIYSASIGLTSHPELKHITDIVGEYHTEITQNASMLASVVLGAGRTAFVLDKCYGVLGETDPKFAIAIMLDEIFWPGIKASDFAMDNR